MNSSDAAMLEFTGGAARVLVVGSDSAVVTRRLLDDGRTVTVLDRELAGLEAAGATGCRTKTADLDTCDLAGVFEAERFDAVVFAGSLERMRDPWRVLDGARTVLTRGGTLVAALPNVAHGAIRLALLAGKFDYRDVGILDGAQLRFFTRRTIVELFVRSGFTVERFERMRLPLFEPSDLVPSLDAAAFDAATIAGVRRDPECETLRFVVQGNALDDAEKTAHITKLYVATNRELEAADDRLASQAASFQTQLDACGVIIREREATLRALDEQNAAIGQKRFDLREGEERMRDLHHQVSALEKQNAELRALYERAVDEAFRARQVAARSESLVIDVRALNEGLAAALRLASDQLDASGMQRLSLERELERLTLQRDDAQIRVTTAERALHAYLRDFADEFGNIGDAETRRHSIATLRSAYPLIVAQLESMDAAVHVVSQARRSWRERLRRRPAILRRVAGRVRRTARRLLRRSEAG